jgi:hypothetical protein
MPAPPLPAALAPVEQRQLLLVAVVEEAEQDRQVTKPAAASAPTGQHAGEHVKAPRTCGRRRATVAGWVQWWT